jgi:hypothetical protein
MFHLDTPNFEAPAVGVATSPNITGAGMWGRRQARVVCGAGGLQGLQPWWTGTFVQEA